MGDVAVREMHADGSAAIPADADRALFGRRSKHLWPIVNDTQPPESHIVPDHGAPVVPRSHPTLIKAETRRFAPAWYAAALRLGTGYKIASIDRATGSDQPRPPEPGYTRAVFDLGERESASGTAWRPSFDGMRALVAR